MPATAVKEVILEADEVVGPREVKPAEQPPFTPVVFRNIRHPAEKIVRSQKERLPDGRWRVRQLPRLEFINTYFVAKSQEEVDLILRTCGNHVWRDDAEMGPLLTYTDAGGKVVFKTHNPIVYQEYIKKRMS
jgi:hypothetical protein